MARALRILSVALISAGAVVLADVAMTLAWKEPVSSLYGSIQQGRLAGELERLEEEFPSEEALRAVERAEGVRAKVRVLAGRFERQLDVGDAIGRVRIPSIGVDYVLVHGTDTGSLQRGPGHYPDTRLPGLGGTAGVAAHRTTYLAPFRHIDEVSDGDEVVMELPYASFTYRVQKHEVVAPTDVGIVDDAGYERAVLTACHPLYSAAKRYAVFAKLDSVSLFVPGDRRWVDP